MDFSFLRNWFSATGTSASSIDSQLEQSSSILAMTANVRWKNMMMNLRSLKIMNL